MAQVAIQPYELLTSRVMLAIEQQDAAALYTLAPALAQLSLTEWAPLETGIRRGMQSKSGFSIKTLKDLIKERNEARVGGGKKKKTEDAAAADIAPTPLRPTGEFQSFSDRGNAVRLLQLYGKDLRYCHAWKQWIIYEGDRWIPDETGAIVRRCEGLIQWFYQQASLSDDPGERKGLANWALRTEAFRCIPPMLSWASARPGVAVTPDDLDSNPWVLNVKNGTFDLKTGKLRPAKREDLATKQAAVAYDPNAQCPRWLAFLDRVMGSNQNLISYLQRAVGYSLTGSHQEHVMFIPYGKGRNGKSTFIDKLMDLLASYAENAPTSMLMSKRNDGIPNDVARLKGTRFVSCQEPEQGRSLAESLVKQITGDKRISARFLHANWFTFEPTCKIWMSTNYKPTIRGTDDGIWRRIHLIPFNVQIPEDEVDRSLPEKLAEELPGILNWAIAGCLAWQEQGLNPPAEVLAANNEYRREQDSLKDFFEDTCVISPTARVSVQKLFKAYLQWCEDSGERPSDILTKNQFGSYLKREGYAQGRTNKDRYWMGIGLLSTDDGPPDPEPEQQRWMQEPETTNQVELPDDPLVEPGPLDGPEEIAEPEELTEAADPPQGGPAPAAIQDGYAGTAYSYQQISQLYQRMARKTPPDAGLLWDVPESEYPAGVIERSQAGTRLRMMIESKETCKVQAALDWMKTYLGEKKSTT